jgi:hypothetical protein
MKFTKSEILFKTIWIVLILITVYVFSWLTFIHFILEDIGTEKYTIWNLIIPNILTFGILIIYSKEIIAGYKPKTKSRNLKSLIIFSTLIIILSLLQYSQFEFILEESKSHYWGIILCLIIVLTSYIGIISNRILKLKGSKK